MAEHYHYPPEVLSLLIDTIPLLCRGKKDVVLFFRGAGVAEADLALMDQKLRDGIKSVNKYEIARDILGKINDRGDSGLRPRREVIKRVVEFEDFSTCWPNDQMKAKGCIASLRDIVNVKDSFTRMKQEKDLQRNAAQSKHREDQEKQARKRQQLEEINKQISSLFSMDDNPQARGRLLEQVLNNLFKAFGIGVREDFRRRDHDNGIVVEQIDGVIELEGRIYLVEMKWLNSPVGIGDLSPHLSRLFLRGDAGGIFISSSGFTSPVISECKSALGQKTIFLCSLQEIVLLMQRQSDLIDFLKKKLHAAVIDKEPYIEILN